MDLVAYLLKNEGGVGTIAIFIDYLSKYAYLVLVSTAISINELDKLLLAIIIARYRVLE